MIIYYVYIMCSTNHYLVAVHNVSCAVLVCLIVFTCCEPPRCLQVRCRLTCSNRTPNRFISSRFAVAGARSFVPTIYPPPKRSPKIYARTFFPRRHCGRRMTFTPRYLCGGDLLRTEHTKCVIIIIIIIVVAAAAVM